MARSKKEISAIVSAMGLLMQIITALLELVRQKGGSEQDIYRLATPDGKSLLEQIADLIVKAGKAPAKFASALDEQIEGWGTFYKEVFGIELDCSNLKIPEKRPGFDRLLVIAQGLTAERIFECHDRRWKFCDGSLDDELESEERSAKDGTYAIWVRDVVAADEQYKNRSADWIAREGILTETLTERLLHGLKFFRETGGHLDLETWTLCSGSRFRGGRVPLVDFYGVYRVGVDYCGTVHFYPPLRAREVVPPTKLAV